MAIKNWFIKTPLLSGIFVASAFAQAARAAELPPSQPIPTPGIPTPDQAVRQMARNAVLDSRASAALSNSNVPPVSKVPRIGADRIDSLPTTNPPVSSLPLTAGLPNPSGVLNSCPTNVCGLVATQPPVILGTVAPSGISKNEQNRLTGINSVPPNTAPKVDLVPLQAITPNDQITSAAKISLSSEPGLSKDVAFGQPAAKSVKTEKSDNSQSVNGQPDIAPMIAKVDKPEKAIGFGDVQSQITSFTGQLVANSWKLITVLPKPQLDSSLLNIGSNSLVKQSDTLSFSPRLTLGTVVELVSPTKISSSLSASPLFTSQKPVVKAAPAVIQWNQSSFFAQPWNKSVFKLDKLNAYTGFSQFDRLETSTKPFSIMTFLASINTATLSSNKLDSQNY